MVQSTHSVIRAANSTTVSTDRLLPATRTEPKVENSLDRFRQKKRVNLTDALVLMQALRRDNPHTLVPVLGLLNLHGKPYNLNEHFFMEPIFRTNVPKQFIFKCGRQVTKSTCLAANGVIRAAGKPHLKILFVTPRFEQIRKFSNNYVRPFIKQSVLRKILVDTDTTQQTLQRTFANQSTMFFSFAFLDPDRVRGISTDITCFDEIQDLDIDFLPAISSCMDHSPLALSLYSGTPKTMDNTAQALWEDSSQAEWVTRCDACGYWSMAAFHADLLKMIEPAGVSCARCKKLINPATGHWFHTNIKDRPGFQGYHVPQVIVPLHYANPEKWKTLIEKRDGRHGYDKAKFMNEILGESADSGVKLVTLTDIRAASVLGVNHFATMIDRFRALPIRLMGVDWGGGGEKETSFTTIALLGYNPTQARYEVHYCERFPIGMTHDDEARRIMYIFREAGCMFFAHDYGGSGSVRETLMVQSGLPLDIIVPFMYTHSASRNIVVYNAPGHGEFRGYYSLDKTRSLVLQAMCIKSKLIVLPEYESSKSVTRDFLALVEDKREMPRGPDVMLIKRIPKQSDDFAHALNYATCALWHRYELWPDLSAVQGLKLSEEQLNFANPPNAWANNK